MGSEAKVSSTYSFTRIQRKDSLCSADLLGQVCNLVEI